MREEAEVFGNESKMKVGVGGGNIAEERLMEDDAWNDIEGMVKEDDGGS